MPSKATPGGGSNACRGRFTLKRLGGLLKRRLLRRLRPVQLTQ